MSGINKVMLVGHLAKDPDIRQLSDDVLVATFTLATTETINKQGKKIEHTEWHNIVMWRGVAENAGKMLRKGCLVHLEGKIRTRVFTDSAGINRYSTEIVVDHFTVLGRKNSFLAEAEQKIKQEYQVNYEEINTTEI